MIEVHAATCGMQGHSIQIQYSSSDIVLLHAVCLMWYVDPKINFK